MLQAIRTYNDEDLIAVCEAGQNGLDSLAKEINEVFAIMGIALPHEHLSFTHYTGNCSRRGPADVLHRSATVHRPPGRLSRGFAISGGSLVADLSLPGQIRRGIAALACTGRQRARRSNRPASRSRPRTR